MAFTYVDQQLPLAPELTILGDKNQMSDLSHIDPLNLDKTENEKILREVRRRELSNIIKSYVSGYDLFSEAIQNALDSIDRRQSIENAEGNDDYRGVIKLHINLDRNEITVTDNGTGFEEREFKAFIAPNMSFNKGNDLGTRGNKGVGASYLAFGFDFFCINTKSPSFEHCGEINDGRSWVENTDPEQNSPLLIETTPPPHMAIEAQGASVRIRVGGEHTKPKTLSWFGATTPEQWSYLLRAKTPLGTIKRDAEHISCEISVLKDSETTMDTFQLGYPYPHELFSAPLELDEVILWQRAQTSKNKPIDKRPSKFKKRTGVYKHYSLSELEQLGATWSQDEIALMRQHQVTAYGAFVHSVDVWDQLSDKKMELRKGLQLLKGGLLIANNGMTQGEYITIPLTSSIGYQKQCHVVVHMENADPDLGRKGFQPEITELCKELSKRIVTNSLKQYRDFLKPNTQHAHEDAKQKILAEWIQEQTVFQKENPLHLKSKHFFKPTNEISINSVPQKEQDVIALFNQLIAGGVIRSIKLLATSQTMQYDGILEYVNGSSEEIFGFHEDKNPLGLEPDNLKDFTAQPQILEYKHNLDFLIQDFDNEEKRPDEISLAICWELGNNWRNEFTCTSLLLNDNIPHRRYHGLTHRLCSNTSQIDVIVLSELIEYLEEPDMAKRKQYELYGDEG